MEVVLVFACSDVTSDDDDDAKDEDLFEKFRFFKFVVSLVLSPSVGFESELELELERGLPTAAALEPSRLCSLLFASVAVSVLAVIGSDDDGSDGSDGSEGHGSLSSSEASELGEGGGDTVLLGWSSQTVASPCSSSIEPCFFSA